MIGKISDPRGQRVTGLLYYLFGPGRREEHVNPRIVAGWRNPAELEPPLNPGGRRDFRKLTGLLEQPHAALGPRGFERPVWHCALRAAPQDRHLSDDEWAAIAADVMHRIGLAPHGQEDEAVRWIAVRHGPDHVHIVATLARQDGGRPRLSNERYRLREACRSAEEQYDLRRTAPADRTAARRATRAEKEKAARNGWSEPARTALRHAVSTAAAGAVSEEEFFTRLAQSGLLIRRRYSTRDPEQVTGYAVALARDANAEGAPVWYSGGKLAPDLTLLKLRQRWSPGATPVGRRISGAERNAVLEQAARGASRAAEQIRHLALTDPQAAADAAWAAADVLHVAASVLGNKAISRAVDEFDRAARAPYGRIPHPSHSGNSLRSIARLLASIGLITDSRVTGEIQFAVQLAKLIESIADLRRIQRHAAQSAAARRAVEHLHAHGHTLRATASNVARLDIPVAPAVAGSRPPGASTVRPAYRTVRTQRPRSGPGP